MLKVTAKDFGPIIEGTVELKPLTVFVGASNTGKSYMATLIYALMQALMGPTSHLPSKHAWSVSNLGSGLMSSNMWAITNRDWATNQQFKDDVMELVQSKETDDDSHIQFQIETLSAAIQRMANTVVESSLVSVIELVSGELQRCFGETKELQRGHQSAGQLRVDLGQDKPMLSLSGGLEANSPDMKPLRQDFDLSGSVIAFPRVFFQHMQRDFRIVADYMDRDFQSVVSMLAQSGMFHLFSDSPENSYYLPAARSGITQGHKAIASILVRHSAYVGIRPVEIPTFPGVITDFIGHFLTMEDSRARWDLGLTRTNIPDFFEEQITGGKILLESTGPLTYPDMFYEAEAGKFPLSRTSSMVSELAPLVLFLKYLVRPGDLLILEEPESHLHPQAQRQMARGIVRLVNAGVKVLITTHSDYFLNQVNNLLRISHASDQWLEQHGFERADCLARDDVSAYLFRWDDKRGGSLVDELTIRPDVGIDDDEFGKVVNDQYEETILVEGIPLK